MTQQKPAYPPGSIVLVTGANGYLASAVTKVLLEMGYRVRGTVRTPKPWLNEYFKSQFGPGRFETVTVADFQSPENLEEAINGVSGIAHVAHDMTWSSDPNIAVTPAVNAVVNLLTVAGRHESVKRVVLTSSIGAAPYIDVYGNPKTEPVDEGDWNDLAVEAAWSDSTPEERRADNCYGAAKVEADRQALRWVHDNQVGFDVNIVMPGFSLGRVLHPNITGQSMSTITGLLRGEPTRMFDFVPPWFIDIEDVARLHVVGLLKPDFASNRIFACASPFTWKEVIRILRDIYPENTKIPDGPEENRLPCHVIPAAKAETFIQELFGRRGFTSLQESLVGALA